MFYSFFSHKFVVYEDCGFVEHSRDGIHLGQTSFISSHGLKISLVTTEGVKRLVGAKSYI